MADTDITVNESNANQIDIKVATANDFIITANKFEVQASSVIDMNGQELILDADADTSITSDTDDQIDIKIAGADDFKFTANSMNILSGSTLAIDSGATITSGATAGIVLTKTAAVSDEATNTGDFTSNNYNIRDRKSVV